MTDAPPEKKPITLPPITEGNIGSYVAKYVLLRDKIKAIKAADAERLESFNEMLTLMNSMFIEHLAKQGTDSFAVKGAGTVYKTTKRTASIKDADAFKRHVIGAQDFDLLDWKANVKAVEAFIEGNNGELPPGVSISSMVTAGVRRDD